MFNYKKTLEKKTSKNGSKIEKETTELQVKGVVSDIFNELRKWFGQ